MNNALQLFEFEQQKVKVIEIDGEPWFSAADVCAVLGLSNVTRALSRISTEDKMNLDAPVRNGNNLTSYRGYAINEPGVFALILTSRKPEAKAFKRWVTHEVLPAIRKTGSYSTTPQPPAPQSPAELLHQMTGLLVAQERQIAENAARVAQLETVVTGMQQREQANTLALIAPERAPSTAPKTDRMRLVELVQFYAVTHSVPFHLVWEKLYRETRQRLHFDAVQRAKNNLVKPLDEIENNNLMAQVYGIASEILV